MTTWDKPAVDALRVLNEAAWDLGYQQLGEGYMYTSSRDQVLSWASNLDDLDNLTENEIRYAGWMSHWLEMNG